MMLTSRQENVLKIIVGEYVQTATPVASQSVVRKHGLGVSPATVRNEMATLEEAGYVVRPHTSAGSVPADKGYRYFVEALLDKPMLTPEARRIVRSQFDPVEQSPEAWTRISASVLSNLAQNLAFARPPTTSQVRLKHLELVALDAPSVLLVLVLQGAKIRRQVVKFEDPSAQDALTSLGHQLTERFCGKSLHEIAPATKDLPKQDAQVMSAVLRILREEEARSYEEMVIAGMRHVLGQPEFANVQMARALVETFEDQKALSSVLESALNNQGFCIIIGSENQEKALRPCSIILARYGEGDTAGAIGILGPTRMRYHQTIAAVRYLASVMSEMVASVRDSQPGPTPTR